MIERENKQNFDSSEYPQHDDPFCTFDIPCKQELTPRILRIQQRHGVHGPREQAHALHPSHPISFPSPNNPGSHQLFY